MFIVVNFIWNITTFTSNVRITLQTLKLRVPTAFFYYVFTLKPYQLLMVIV